MESATRLGNILSTLKQARRNLIQANNHALIPVQLDFTYPFSSTYIFVDLTQNKTIYYRTSFSSDCFFIGRKTKQEIYLAPRMT